MPEEAPDAEVREKGADFRQKFRVLLVSGILRGGVAVMDQGLSEIEILLEGMHKIGQFH